VAARKCPVAIDATGSKRKDDKDYIKLFQDAGYKLATDKSELEKAVGSDKILGLFHPGNMDYALDRMQLKKGTVDKFPNQPGLVEMTKVALDNLSRNPEGFFLMVEGACIDKASHPLDMERAVFDTIEFVQADALAREFQAKNSDTLIVVTGDHMHGVSIVGTIGKQGRDKLLVGAGFGLGYAAAEFLAGLFLAQSGDRMPVEFTASDATLAAAFLAVAALMAALPAVLAYRQSPVEALRG